MIMTRYVDLGSVQKLATDLAAKSIVSKRRVNSVGRVTGGTPFRGGALYALLANRLYLGETVHRGVAHPGEHDAIVDQALWDAVQSLLATNRVTRRHQGNAKDPSLIAGMIRDSHGQRMSPRHAGKLERRYRYYVSVPDEGNMTALQAPITRVAAGEVEAAIIEGVTALLNDPGGLLAALDIEDIASAQIEAVTCRAADIAAELEAMPPAPLHAVLHELDLQVTVDRHVVTATVGRVQLAAKLGTELSHETRARCSLPMPETRLRTGNEVRLAIAPSAPGAPTARDAGLVALIAKAHRARDLLVGQGGDDCTPSTPEHRHLTRLARIAWLAPDITTAILEGRQPRTMTSRSLLRMAGIPLDWNDQRKALGVR